MAPDRRCSQALQVESGQIEIQVVNSYQDSTITTFTAALNRSCAEITSEERSLWSKLHFVNIVLIFLSACGGIYWIQNGAPLWQALLVASSALSVSALLSLLLFMADWKKLAFRAMFFFGGLLRRVEAFDTFRRVESFLLDYSVKSSPGLSQVTEFELLDDRVEEEGLIGVLLTLLGGCDHAQATAITQYLRARLKTLPKLFPVEDLQIYRNLGVAGTVQQIEISVGSEEFLIERGVHLQQSELEASSEDGEWLYIALETEVVAKLFVKKPFLSDGGELIRRLHAQGVRAVLCSEDTDQKSLDHLGKQVGLELADISGDLDEQQFSDKIDSCAPTALYLNSETKETFSERADLTMALFDEIHWDLDVADVMLFSPRASMVADLFRVTRRYFRLCMVSLWGVGLLSAILLTLGVMGIISPMVVLFAILLATISLAFFSLQLLPQAI